MISSAGVFLRIPQYEIAEDAGNITISVISTDTEEREAYIKVRGQPCSIGVPVHNSCSVIRYSIMLCSLGRQTVQY